ncbi:MAG TPA: CvpA family protein [Candidatus Nitrosotalea sp.]|nr:CvpA family protein [Candidatus Nitrosotalea sp.]
MTWLDVLVFVILLIYGVGGYFTGVLRRLIGFVALYAGLFAATHMGLQAGLILQQTSNFETPDSRIYGFFGILFAVLLIVEVGTQIAHNQIQIPGMVLNRTLGVAFGLITAIVLSVVLVYELGNASQPFGGATLSQVELHIRDAYQGSHVVAPVVRAIQRPFINLLQPALPADPQIYFSRDPVIQ